MKFDNENVVLKFIIVSNILNAFIIYIFNKYDFLAGLSKIKTEYIIVFLIRFYFLTQILIDTILLISISKKKILGKNFDNRFKDFSLDEIFYEFVLVFIILKSGVFLGIIVNFDDNYFFILGIIKTGLIKIFIVIMVILEYLGLIFRTKYVIDKIRGKL